MSYAPWASGFIDIAFRRLLYVIRFDSIVFGDVNLACGEVELTVDKSAAKPTSAVDEYMHSRQPGICSAHARAFIRLILGLKRQVPCE